MNARYSRQVVSNHEQGYPPQQSHASLAPSYGTTAQALDQDPYTPVWNSVYSLFPAALTNLPPPFLPISFLGTHRIPTDLPGLFSRTSILRLSSSFHLRQAAITLITLILPPSTILIRPERLSSCATRIIHAALLVLGW